MKTELHFRKIIYASFFLYSEGMVIIILAHSWLADHDLLWKRNYFVRFLTWSAARKRGGSRLRRHMLRRLHCDKKNGAIKELFPLTLSMNCGIISMAGNTIRRTGNHHDGLGRSKYAVTC